jgi:hypothetical protein
VMMLVVAVRMRLMRVRRNSGCHALRVSGIRR